MKNFKLAIVGCGWAGDIHMTDLAQIEDLFEVVACCDTDADRSATFARKHSIPAALTSFDEICALSEIDAVVLCTPPMLHCPMTLTALAAGKSVVCEKPLTSSLALADKMAAAEATSLGRVMPIFQYRFGDGAAKIKHIIESGLAGRHFVTSVDIARTRGADYYKQQWRGKFATELGGVHVTQAIHIQDMLSWMLGPPQSVMSMRATRVNPIEVEDCAVTSLRLHDGSLMAISSTLGSVGQLTRIRMCFENVTFERLSNHDLSKPADEPWLIQPRDEAAAAAIESKAAEVLPGKHWFARQYELFHKALAEGSELPVTLRDARASLESITAMYYSNETGTEVKLPITRDHPHYGGWIPTRVQT